MKGGNKETFDVLQEAIEKLKPYTDEIGTLQPYDDTENKDIVDSMKYFLNNKQSSNVLTKQEKTDLEKLLKKQIDHLEDKYMSTFPNGVEDEDEVPKKGGRSRKRYKKRSSRRASRRKSRRASRRRKASRRRRK